MSYPEPVYTGDTGEVSARLRPAGADPDLGYPNGVQVHYLVTGESSRGNLGLYRWDFSAARSGPDPHFHRGIAEAFFVLSGTVRLYDGQEWRDGHAGDYLYVPEGGRHGFRNESGAEASMLLMFVPGAPREDYFETLARLASGEQPPMTDDERTAFMLRHDTFWV
jgi:quercetin dioxygenase-like cupin family protein